MWDQFWFSQSQLKRIEPYFPLSLGVPRVDDRRVVSGIIHVIRNGLRWRDAPEVYGPHKTLYNRFVRWSRMGVFDRIFAALAAEDGPPDRLMIDATTAPRRACSKRGCSPPYRPHQGRAERQAARGVRRRRAPDHPVALRRPDERSQGLGDDPARPARRRNADRRQGLRQRCVPRRSGGA